VALLDADVVVMSYSTPALKESFEGSPLFSGLNAVKNKRYYALDGETIAALRFPTPLKIPWTLDKLAPFFATIK
jgi:iron complex transport system substrate-binding protein